MYGFLRHLVFIRKRHLHYIILYTGIITFPSHHGHQDRGNMEGGWCVSSAVSTAGGTARAMGDLEKEEPYIRHLCPRSAVCRIRYFVQRVKFKLAIKFALHSVHEIS